MQLQRLHLDRELLAASAPASPQNRGRATNNGATTAPPAAPQVTRLLLFARADREKEDWYRRLVAASRGHVTDRRPPPPSSATDENNGVEPSTTRLLHANGGSSSFVSFIEPPSPAEAQPAAATTPSAADANERSDGAGWQPAAEEANSGAAEGADEALLLMTPCAHRGPADYVRFVEHYKVGKPTTHAEPFELEHCSPPLGR